MRVRGEASRASHLCMSCDLFGEKALAVANMAGLVYIFDFPESRKCVTKFQTEPGLSVTDCKRRARSESALRRWRE